MPSSADEDEPDENETLDETDNDLMMDANAGAFPFDDPGELARGGGDEDMWLEELELAAAAARSTSRGAASTRARRRRRSRRGHDRAPPHQCRRPIPRLPSRLRASSNLSGAPAQHRLHGEQTELHPDQCRAHQQHEPVPAAATASS